jgi:hypothetical protein
MKITRKAHQSRSKAHQVSIDVADRKFSTLALFAVNDVDVQ